MPTSVPSAGRLSAVLTRALPYFRRPIPLHDADPDPGLFGPGSVTWRVMGEPLLILGAGRALLMQASNPLVAQAAVDHSQYAADPFGRLMRTVRWVTVVSFGTRAEARAVCGEVNRLHVGITGRMPVAGATPAVPARRAYRAADPRLLRWVHACFVDTMVRAHDALVGGLDAAARDAFVLEWNAVAGLMEVPPGLHFTGNEELAAYIDAEVSSGRCLPGPGSRTVARTILSPPLRRRADLPLWELARFVNAGLLPADVRRGYGIAWSPAHGAAHAAFCLSLRRSHRVLPRRLRVSPVLEMATDRVAARLEPRPRQRPRNDST